MPSRRLQLLSEEPSTIFEGLVEAGFQVVAMRDLDALSPAQCTVVDGRHFGPEIGARLHGPFVVVEPRRTRDGVRAWVAAGAGDVAGWPCSPRELAVRTSAVALEKTKIACIGGGTGLFNLLLGLKIHRDLQLTSVVAMSDDGGSSGRLRAEFGMLPPGDIRRSLVALSDAPELMNDVVQFRFDTGEGIAGHSLGNLVLTALAKIRGSFDEGVRALADILHIRGIVACATTVDTRLCAKMHDQTIVRGESAIDTGKGRDLNLRIDKVWLEPEASCSIDAFVAILTADLVTIGPGDLYTSIIANIVVDGIAEALRTTSGRVVYICNLMTKPGETPDYSTADHVDALVQHIGGDPIDDVITSATEPDRNALDVYASRSQHPVRGPLGSNTTAKLIEADISDPERLVRHDPMKLAEEIRKLRPRRGQATVDLRPRP